MYSRVAIGTENGLTCGYDLDNSCFFITDSSGALFANSIIYDSNDIIVPYQVPLGNWINIAYRFTSTSVIIYANGVQVASANYGTYGLTRQGWIVYMPKNITFYQDNYILYINGYIMDQVTNLGEYPNGTSNMVWNMGGYTATTLPVMDMNNMIYLITNAHVSGADDISYDATTYNELSLAQKAWDSLTDEQKAVLVADGWDLVLKEGWDMYNELKEQSEA